METKNELMSVSYELANGDTMKLDADIVKKYLTNGNAALSDKEIAYYINLCKAQRLNPFLKDAFLVKYSQEQPASIIVSKEAFMKRADENPNYEGKEDGIIVLQKNGEVKERPGAFVLPNETVVGGWAKVFIKNKKPVYVSVSTDEYTQRTKTGEANSMWKTKPATMIRKVAIVQALREAFPNSLKGMYIEEEIQKEDDDFSNKSEENYTSNYDLSEINQTNNENKISDFEEYDDDLPDEVIQRELEFVEAEDKKFEKENEIIEIPYSEYVNNKEKYERVKNGYNRSTNTIKVTRK